MSMPNFHEEIPSLSFYSIPFPSDNLTFGTLRRLGPHLFDVQFGDLNKGFFRNPAITTDIQNMFYDERVIAKHAYDIACGKPVDFFKDHYRTLRSAADDLATIYTKYELATGKHQAEEFIRTFQRAAAAQASIDRGIS